MNIDEDKLKVAKWIFEFYDKKTIKQIYNLLLEFDSNPKTSDFNQFLKNSGYK